MPPSIKHRPYRIVSYNIRKARGLDGRHDPGRILDTLNKLDADVIALQEADHRLGARSAAVPKTLIQMATDFDLVPLATNDVSLGWHGNAVLIRKGLRVSKARRIELPGLEPRGAVAVEITDGPTVVGVHLGLLRRSRQRQLSKITSELGQAERTIVIGDMNEWSGSRGLEALEQGFRVYSPGRSFHAARPIAALDRVALSRDLQLVDAGVEQGPLAKTASDHLPIWAEVS